MPAPNTEGFQIFLETLARRYNAASQAAMVGRNFGLNQVIHLWRMPLALTGLGIMMLPMWRIRYARCKAHGRASVASANAWWLFRRGLQPARVEEIEQQVVVRGRLQNDATGDGEHQLVKGGHDALE
jgi:hypothetical protein